MIERPIPRDFATDQGRNIDRVPCQMPAPHSLRGSGSNKLSLPLYCPQTFQDAKVDCGFL